MLNNTPTQYINPKSSEREPNNFPAMFKNAFGGFENAFNKFGEHDFMFNTTPETNIMRIKDGFVFELATPGFKEEQLQVATKAVGQKKYLTVQGGIEGSIQGKRRDINHPTQGQLSHNEYESIGQKVTEKFDAHLGNGKGNSQQAIQNGLMTSEHFTKGFQQSFPIPFDSDIQTITYENGLLQIFVLSQTLGGDEEEQKFKIGYNRLATA